jgi:hypothetical protein
MDIGCDSSPFGPLAVTTLFLPIDMVTLSGTVIGFLPILDIFLLV